MYLREVHAERNIQSLRQLIRDNPFGILTTAIASPRYPLLQSTHLPFVLDVDDETSETELGRLRGHMARQNPHSQAMMDALRSSPSLDPSGCGDDDGDTNGGSSRSAVLVDEVMVLFTSPVQHYVTPQFYVETKPATAKVVPTWNYAAAQAYGHARVYFDAHAADTAAFLARQVDDLSRLAEKDIMGHTGEEGRPAAWQVADAPEPFLRIMQKNIIGIEIAIDRLEGKFKMSQELREGDRRGVIDGFRALGSEAGEDMAELVSLRSEMKKASGS